MFAQALLSLTVLVAPAPPLPSLQWKFREGDVFSIRAETTTRQVIVVMGNEIVQTQDIAVTHRYTVKKILRDGSVDLEQVITDTTGTMKIGGGEQKVPATMKGARFTFTIHPRRGIIDFQGLAAFIKGLDPTQQSLVSHILNEDTLKFQLSELFCILPGKNASPGDTWERESKQSMGPIGSFELKSKYRHDSRPRLGNLQVEKLTWTSQMRYVPPAPAAPQQQALPFQITRGDLKAEDFKGVLHFDSKAGRIVDSTTAYRMRGKLTIDIGGVQTEVDLDMHTTTKSVLQPEPAPRKNDDR